MRPRLPFLDEVEEQQSPAHVALGDGDHQAQVGLGQPALGLDVLLLDRAWPARSPAPRSAAGPCRSRAGTCAPGRRRCGRWSRRGRLEELLFFGEVAQLLGLARRRPPPPCRPAASRGTRARPETGRRPGPERPPRRGSSEPRARPRSSTSCRTSAVSSRLVRPSQARPSSGSRLVRLARTLWSSRSSWKRRRCSCSDVAALLESCPRRLLISRRRYCSCSRRCSSSSTAGAYRPWSASMTSRTKKRPASESP